MSCDSLTTVSPGGTNEVPTPQVSVKIKVWFYWIIKYLVNILPVSLAHGFLNFLSWLTILTPYRCSRCDKCLPNWYFEKDGRLFCQTDYWARFGDSCNGCSDLITGPVMVAGEHRYHPECFKCVHCECFIGNEETYALVERSKLFCGTCYKKVMKPLLAASPRRRKPHSIQLVEIPPTPDGNRGIQFSSDRKRQSWRSSNNSDMYRKSPLIKITDLDVSPDLQGLRIGDRILEVNGLNVRDKSTEEMDEIFNNSTDTLHITLERDPSPLCLNSDSDSPSDSNNCLSSPEEVVIGNTPVKLRQKSSLKARGYSPSRRRSKSPSPLPPNRSLSIDLNRSHSLRTQSGSHRVFRVNDLTIGDVLGQGFFGQAIMVTHKVTGEVMVLKELFNFNEEAQKNFLQEVHMLRNLDHPCVLKFMGVLYKEKKLNLVTEYIAGGTLTEHLLDENISLSYLQRIKFVKDISNGLSYLHSRDIIHRDLTSHNCLVKLDKTVVVSDFGLAKIMPKTTEVHHPDIERNITPTKYGSRRKAKKKRYTVVGSPYWMAPEMMNGKIYDERVDIFSYGIIVCEVIARITADPDYLPRTLDFGLNMESFYRQFSQNCPDPIFMLAALCCQLDPIKRPNFSKISMLCEALFLREEHNAPLPCELLGDPVIFHQKVRDELYAQLTNEKKKKDKEKNNALPPKVKRSSLDSISEQNKTVINEVNTSHQVAIETHND